MMFSLDDEDDFSVSSGASSNLASLFTSDKIATKDGNQSLMYNAPKQPKKSKPSSTGKQSQSSGKPQMDIIHATVVTTFMYDGSKHVAQGKLGIALIGNHSLPLYKILLYKGQQQHVAFATIIANFQFIIQANNYATFYDDNKQNWSVNFENEQTIIAFAKEICIAKANTMKPMESIVFQDLILGEGESLDSRDTVEIKYTGWFLTNNKLGEVFDSNISAEKPLRLKIHQGKCIKGIESGLVGMKKSGKRLIIVPPSLGYANIPDSDVLLKTNVLIYELEVKRCKFSKDSSSSRSSTPISADAELDKKLDVSQSSGSDEISIRARGASLSEQLSQSPSKKKATIISRIVKMGQPMLPLQGAIAVQPSSESETEEEIANVIQTQQAAPVSSVSDSEVKPIPKPRPQQMTHVAAPIQTPVPSLQTSAQSVSVYQSSPLLNPQLPHSYPVSATSPFSVMPQTQYSHAVASPVVVGGGDAHLQLLMTENRTQNVEMRMHLSKISDKIDTVISKVETMSGNNQMPLSSMDIASLSFNIQRIFQENETLRKENAEKSEKIEFQNEKICSLLQKNQKYIEQSTDLLEQRSSSLQSGAVQFQLKIEKLEQEKVELLKNITELTNIKDSLSQEYLSLKESIQNLTTEKNGLIQKCQKYQQQYEETLQAFEASQKEIKELQSNLETERELKTNLEDDLVKAKELVITIQGASEKNKMFNDNTEELRKEYETQIANLTEQLKQMKKMKAPLNSSSFIFDEVKKIMNIVYKHLLREFEANETYSGSYISDQLLRTIRKVTLQLMEKYSQEAEGDKQEVPIPETRVSISKEQNVAVSEDDKIDSSKEENLHPSNEEVPVSEHSLSNNGHKENVTEEAVQESLAKKLSNEMNANDSASESWRPQPPPPPSFMEDDDDDDWLN